MIKPLVLSALVASPAFAQSPPRPLNAQQQKACDDARKDEAAARARYDEAVLHPARYLERETLGRLTDWGDAQRWADWKCGVERAPTPVVPNRPG